MEAGMDDKLRNGLSQFGSRNMNRVRTSHFARRQMSYKQLENERKEIEEIQEAMREMDELGKLSNTFSS